MRVLAVLAVVACGGKPAPPAPEPPKLPPVPPAHRADLAVPTMPAGLALHRGHLVWADQAGAIWTMPADGGTPRQLSEQHREGYAFHPFVAAGKVLAKVDKDLVEIALPDGPVTRMHVAGLPELPEEAVGDDAAAYVTLFKHDEILRIAGGAAQHLIDVPRGVLALHGDTLYVASYKTGVLLALPTAGGAPRTLARNLPRPTALAADARAVYVYTERDRRVTRIDLASGAHDTLGEQLENADELVLADGYIYTVSWPHRLVRLPSAPGAPRVLADDLQAPRSIVVDERWIYVASDAPPRIVKIPR